MIGRQTETRLMNWSPPKVKEKLNIKKVDEITPCKVSGMSSGLKKIHISTSTRW